MRILALLALAGCVASEAAPPVAGGGGAAAAAGGPSPDSDTYANCVASTPTAEGDVCYPTDSPYTLVSRNGTTWVTRYPGIGFDVTPPPSTSWTAYNSGSVTAVGGVRRSTIPGDTDGSLVGEYRTQPATPFYVDAVFAVPVIGSAGGAGVGLGGTDATGVAQIWLSDTDGTRAMIAASRWSAHTTFTATDAQAHGYATQLIGLRYVDNGTNRQFYTLSPVDGALNKLGGDYGRTVTITATSIGWWGSTADADLPRSANLVHWATGTP